jgi:hypothetical protein
MEMANVNEESDKLEKVGFFGWGIWEYPDMYRVDWN